MKRTGAALLCGALLSASGSIITEAMINDTYPIIDPTVNTEKTLPAEYDQALPDGLPYGYFVVGDDADYSFGVAADSKGCFYYASYNTGSVIKCYPDFFGQISMLSKRDTIKLNAQALFTIAIDNDDNIIFSSCNGDDGYIGIYDVNTGSRKQLIRGLTRPNQVAVDTENNIYVACENGEIYKWTRKTETSELIASNLGILQSVLAAPDGTLYALSYGRVSESSYIGVAHAGGTLYQINPDGTAEAVAGGDDKYVWRARGLAMDSYGYLYLTGEGNAWDNGNSSVVARYDPRTRTLESYCTGMDYATFITCSEDGRIYQCLARDDLAVAYTPAAVDDFVLQDFEDENGCRMITWGGSFANGASAEGEDVVFNVGSVTVSGKLKLNDGSGKICGWLSVPETALPELKKESLTEDGWNYEKPSYSMKASGTWDIALMLKRVHQRSRWPMIDIYHPYAEFSEAPEAFLIYFEWTPYTADTWEVKGDPNEAFRDTSLENTSPAYSSAQLDSFNMSNSSGKCVMTESGEYVCGLDDTVYALVRGWQTRCTFKWTPDSGEDVIEISLDNRGVNTGSDGEGVRIRMDAEGKISAALVNESSGICLENAGDKGCLIYTGSIPGFNIASEHTFEFVNNFGSYGIYLDGICLSGDISDELNEKIALYAGGSASYLAFSSVGGSGELAVREGISRTFSNSETEETGEMSADTDITENRPENNVKTAVPVIAGAAVCVCAAFVALAFKKKKSGK